ncbi:MAG: GNAT family N-acetyltransferase [Solirubrobacteraceae bacterium]
MQREQRDGWLLRATPGLDRGRSNHALTPCRPLAEREVGPAIDRVCAFAAQHGIRPGIQVSPLELHDRLNTALDQREWEGQWPTVVLTGPTSVRRRERGRDLTATDHATDAWLRAWERCEPGRDVEAHAATVFAALRGQARFARLGTEAVAIAVPWQHRVGMFCLAVDPAQRRGGLATVLVSELLAGFPAADRAYLQVEERNDAARRFYERLGFTEAYRYSHRVQSDRRGA